MNKNLESFIEKYPNSALTAACSRIEKVFDVSDEVICAFSGGKDSSLALQLAINELRKRKARFELGVNRYGEPEYDTRDAYWFKKKLIVNCMHPEWVYTNTVDHQESLMSDNLDVIAPFYKCLKLGWGSGVTFGEDRITSWDEEKEDVWIHPMPKKSKLGFDPVTNENISYANAVPLSDLEESVAAYRLESGDTFDKDGKVLVANWGYGANQYMDYDAWTFKNQDEDHEQESFVHWLAQQIQVDESLRKITNLVSIRGDESLDRYNILRKSDYNNGVYSNEMHGNVQIRLSSPIMDMKTEDIWRAFNLTQFQYSNLYDLMFEANVPLRKQRTASLLNVFAVRNIAQVKYLEPSLYMRMVNRFQNVEMLSSFSKMGYYHVGKPKDQLWNGKNHLKAGMNENQKFMSTFMLNQKLHEMHVDFEVDNNEVNLIEDKFEDLGIKVHHTWQDYFYHLLNTSSEPFRTNWRNKIVSSILASRFQGESMSHASLDALKMMTELDNDLTMSLVDDFWTEDMWKQHGKLKSNKIIISLCKSPQESLTMEAQKIVTHALENGMLYDLMIQSPTLKKLVERWENGDILSAEEVRLGMKRSERFKMLENDEKNISLGNKVWFAETIKDNFSWKRYAIMILKNDTIGKYLGFTPTYKERLSRRKI